jgi:hypothetical protein
MQIKKNSNFMMRYIHIGNLGGFCNFSSVRKYFIRSSPLPVNMVQCVLENRTFVWVQYWFLCHSVLHQSSSTVVTTERFGLTATLQTHIRQVPDSNLDRDTGYSDRVFLLLFYSVPSRKCRDITSVMTRSLPSKPVRIHHLSVILPYDAVEFSFWECCKIIDQKR